MAAVASSNMACMSVIKITLSFEVGIGQVRDHLSLKLHMSVITTLNLVWTDVELSAGLSP